MLRVMLVDDEPFILQGLKILVDWDKDGYEICCTEPQFQVDGDWECYALDEDGGDAHTVRVVELVENVA